MKCVWDSLLKQKMREDEIFLGWRFCENEMTSGEKREISRCVFWYQSGHDSSQHMKQIDRNEKILIV